ncbi:MAG: hypothetical protein J6T15_05020 [Bacilli bacterium]|nr:hypothetical protein [Bacilli bacterium]
MRVHNRILSLLKEEYSDNYKELLSSLHNVAEMFGEDMLDDEGDVFGGTADSYASEMLEQHLFDAIYYNELFSGLGDEKISNIYNEILDYLSSGKVVSEEWLKGLLSKYGINVGGVEEKPKAKQPSKKSYRQSEFKKLAIDNLGFDYQIKIKSQDGETKWLDISPKELSGIEGILVHNLKEGTIYKWDRDKGYGYFTSSDNDNKSEEPKHKISRTDYSNDEDFLSELKPGYSSEIENDYVIRNIGDGFQIYSIHPYDETDYSFAKSKDGINWIVVDPEKRTLDLQTVTKPATTYEIKIEPSNPAVYENDLTAVVDKMREIDATKKPRIDRT